MRSDFSLKRDLVVVVVVVVVFFALTDRASTIPSNIRGCQSGTWSAGQKRIRGTSTKLEREQKTKENETKQKRQKERNNTKIHMPEMLIHPRQREGLRSVLER